MQRGGLSQAHWKRPDRASSRSQACSSQERTSPYLPVILRHGDASLHGCRQQPVTAGPRGGALPGQRWPVRLATRPAHPCRDSGVVGDGRSRGTSRIRGSSRADLPQVDLDALDFDSAVVDLDLGVMVTEIDVRLAGVALTAARACAQGLLAHHPCAAAAPPPCTPPWP